MIMAHIRTTLSETTVDLGANTPSQPLPKSDDEEQKKQAQIIFSKTLQGHYSRGKTGYQRVGALFITWEGDDMQCKETEVDALRDLFKDKFSFKTEFYQIPSARWATGIHKTITDFLHEYDDQECLAIIYYGGHGYNGKETGAYKWAAKADLGSDREPTVFFNDTWTALRLPNCDILLVVDSCNAARAFVREPTDRSKFEILSSAAADEPASSPRQAGSFTRCLTNALTDLLQKHPEGFSTSLLYRELYHTQGIATKPWLFDSARLDRGRIWLRPQKSELLHNPRQAPGKTFLNLTLQLHGTPENVVLNELALSLQYLPHIDQVRFENLYAPKRQIDKFFRVVRQAQKLRPLIRRALARRRVNKIKETLTKEDVRTYEPSYLKLLLEQRPNPVYDWSSAVLDDSCSGPNKGDQHRSKRKSVTWPSTQAPSTKQFPDLSLDLKYSLSFPCSWKSCERLLPRRVNCSGPPFREDSRSTAAVSFSQPLRRVSALDSGDSNDDTNVMCGWGRLLSSEMGLLLVSAIVLGFIVLSKTQGLTVKE
ncbi:hypothetical protein GJ744_009029 [Endocarpon pusillum]|uniref:Peptidase C14 caspase domain-containing protein n=1 Tax=Endocarpon pusillum TaxID=364733 RepID=A0A8H7AIP1_9EURO|nr:hypothetical protein GJ744_009029 [Endocarpon pusillum]